MFYLSRQPIVQLKIFSEENLSGLIYFEIVPFILVELEFEFALNNYRIQ